MLFDKKIFTLIGAATLAGALALPLQAAPYQASSTVDGTIRIKGSDTVGKAFKKLMPAFIALHPKADFDFEEEGSSTGAKSLVAGTADLGAMSRAMKPNESAAFQSKFGYAPTQMTVGIDAIAVVVNSDNPVKGLSIEQLDGIFSSKKTKCGGDRIKKWGDAGISGSLSSAKPTLYSRDKKSGTRAFFQKKALCKGKFQRKMNEVATNHAVVEGVGKDKNGIGYSGLADAQSVSSVKIVPVKGKSGSFVSPSAKTAASGEYPLARSLYVYINKKPGEAFNPAAAEFLRFVLSDEGQEIIEKSGYVSLTSEDLKFQESQL